MAGFLEGLANLATGGLYGALSGSTAKAAGERMDLMKQALADPNSAAAKMADYNPGIGERAANLLTGGIYGGLSGMNEKMANAEAIRRTLMQDQLNQRLAQRMQSYGMQPGQATLNPTAEAMAKESMRGSSMDDPQVVQAARNRAKALGVPGADGMGLDQLQTAIAQAEQQRAVAPASINASSSF